MNFLADVAPDPPPVIGDNPWPWVTLIAVLVVTAVVLFFAVIRPRQKKPKAAGPDQPDTNQGPPTP